MKTDELTIEEAVELLKEKRMEINYQVNGTTQFSRALDMAIKSLRYQPIVLQEHDAEPRRLSAILDIATDKIYIYKFTKQTANILGVTIEEIEDVDGDKK